MRQEYPKDKRGRKKLSKEQYALRLGVRFGRNFISSLKRLENDPFLTGSHIAYRFGITREYIRQICDRLFQKGFLKNRHKRLREKKKKVTEDIKTQIRVSKIERNPRNSAIIAAFRKLKAMGFKPALGFFYNKPRIVLEDTRVITVYSTKHPRKLNQHSQRLYYAYQIKRRPPETDYVITSYFQNGSYTFYIFPKDLFRTKQWILIPYPEDGSYRQYKEAWHVISRLPARRKAV